jgi:hypothetical protein
MLELFGEPSLGGAPLGFSVRQLGTIFVHEEGRLVRMSDVRELLIDQLAYVRACDRSELEGVLGEGSEVEIDSKEGQTVAIRAELLLGLEGLIRPEDQTRENLTTISSLEQLILTRRAEHGNGG